MLPSIAIVDTGFYGGYESRMRRTSCDRLLCEPDKPIQPAENFWLKGLIFADLDLIQTKTKFLKPVWLRFPRVSMTPKLLA